jgi:hypothetical protein
MAGPRAQRRRLSAWILVVVGLVAACGGSTPSPSSGISQATPKPTGDPHLRDPAQIGQVYRALREQGLNILGTTARAGKDPVSTVTGTYAGWPLRLSQYASTRSRLALVAFENRDLPSRGDPPFMFAGLNIVVEWGPVLPNRAPPAATPAQLRAATRLANELNLLVGPIGQRTASPVELAPVAPQASPGSTPAASPSTSPSPA